MDFSKQVAFKIPNNIGLPDQVKSNEVNLLILVAKNDFGDAEMETLQKMIKAIKLDFVADTNLLILEDDEMYSLGLMEVRYHALLAFGIEPKNIGYFINTDYYKIIQFNDLKALFCPSIREIKSRPENTKILWNILQTMFL